MSKRITLTLFVAAALAAGVTQAQQRTAEAALRAAIETEMTRGVSAAIDQYKRVAETYGRTDPSTAAQALVRLAEAYEKSGNSQAQAVYERIVRDFTAQLDAVATARAKLSGEVKARTAAVVMRRVWERGENASSVSPDGRLVSFVDWDSGDLALHEVASGKERRLTKKGTWINGDYAMEGVISPNGKQVAYLWWSQEQGYPDLRLLSFSDTGASDPRVLYNNKDVEWITPQAWSPDGKWIAVQLRRPGQEQIALVHAEKGSLHVVKSIPWGGSSSLAFSPDGKFLAYDQTTNENSEQRDIFVLAIDGRGDTPVIDRETPIMVHPATDVVMDWTPDGKHLLFASDRTGANSLWALPVQDGMPSGTARILKPDIGWPSPLGMTRSGVLFTSTTTGHGHELLLASVDFASGRILKAPTPATHHNIGSNLMADWSPDGKHLAYVTRSTTYARNGALTIRSMDTGQLRELRPDLGNLGWPRWSPDGKSFLAMGTDRKGREGIHRIDAALGKAEFIAAGGNAEWSRDGRSIFLASKTEIAELNLDSGQRREVLRRPEIIGRISISPDGANLACLSVNPLTKSLSLTVVPVLGGEARDLFSVNRGVEGNGGVAWSPDGRSIVFNHGSDNVLMIPATGGSPISIHLGVAKPRALRVQPGGTQLSFYTQSGGLNLNEVSVIENLSSVLDAGK